MPLLKKYITILIGALLVMGNTTPITATEKNQDAAAHTAAAFIQRELAKGSKPNRLIHEKSPYLLQHAFNPVDWYPWGEEAFAQAKKLGMPIFLSIGYSTCHWCHVMAHESFENPEIAAVLNKYFICIKVDREELPDIDQIYMAAAQALTGSGGWPLSVFLTPDLKPFYAGTYFPPEPRYGQPGFVTVLESLHTLWTEKHDKALNAAEELTAHLQKSVAASNTGTEATLDEAVLTKAVDQFAASFNEKNGGFGRAPKFPRPVTYTFLLREYHRTGDKKALEMVRTTLDAMANGGMYDHLGGGFHRYSTDADWFMPHFEKMLYDQAQLAVSYLEAFQITQAPHYAEVARQTMDYVLRDLAHPAGGFYSAEDADSPKPDNPAEKSEGAFYLWHKKDIDALLDAKTAEIFSHHYSIAKAGNIFEDPHGEFGDGNILHVKGSLEKTAAKFKLSIDETKQILAEASSILLEKRDRRPRSHLDDKVITSWNGLMISALAKGSMVLGEERYLVAAKKTADFILDTLRDKKNGTLMRRYRDGAAGLEAHLDDYAFLTQGLIDLYQASLEINWLQEAITLTAKQNELFWDGENGGFFDTAAGGAHRILRMKSEYEGAEPSGNGVAAINLLRLAEMTANQDWQKRAGKTISSFAPVLKKQPVIMPQLLAALTFQLAKPRQIVIAGNPAMEETQNMLQEVQRRFLPDAILLLADGGPGQKVLASYLPLLKTIEPLEGKTTAYLCQNYTCLLPTIDSEELGKRLDRR